MATSNTSCSTTFKVSDVEPQGVTNFNDPSELSICSQLKAYDKSHCTEVLMETQFSSNAQASANNGFVNTVISCYNCHHNLAIRPDDIWTAIMTQFSFYLNANAVEFRDQFVNFKGKKELVVTIDGTLRSAPYDEFVTLITEKINENLVDKTVKEWVLPNFTTTTKNDIISCGIVLMATTKKYFEFRCSFKCGIPYVTLEGSVDDWENILNRLEKLKSYKLDKWYGMLQPIIREFIAAKRNEANIDFWKRICLHSGGSGPRFISGWLTAFAVFDEEGKWTDCGGKIWPKINIDKIPSGIVTVDVKINDINGVKEGVMFAGHVACEVLEDKFTLRPCIGWAMSLKFNAKEIEKYHETALANNENVCDTCNVRLNTDYSDSE